MEGALDPIEKAIFKAIEQNQPIRWRELKKLSVKSDENPDGTSDRTFRQTLNRMVEKRIVTKNEVGKQHTEYLTPKGESDREIFALLYDYTLSKLESILVKLKKKNMNLSTLEKANSFLTIIKILGTTKLMFGVFTEDESYLKYKKLNKKLDSLTEKTYDIILSNETQNDEHLEIFGNLYSQTLINWEKELEQILK